MRFLLSVVIATLVAFAIVVRADTDEGSFEGSVNCMTMGVPPGKPRSLSFCHKFNDNACCLPQLDQDLNEGFDHLFDLGLSCRLRGDVRSTPMAKFYCSACDPDQPKYVRHEPYVPTCDSNNYDNCDIVNVTLANVYPGTIFNDTVTPDNIDYSTLTDVSSLSAGSAPAIAYLGDGGQAAYIPTLVRTKTMLVCTEWAQASFGPLTKGDNGYMDQFSRCGLLKSAPCLDINGDIIPNRDRFTCGDDLVFPATFYDSVEAFLNVNDMGPLQLDQAFGFKLVSNKVCDDADLATLNATYKNAFQGGNLKAQEFDIFSPNCLRTRAQIQRYGVSPWSKAFNLTAYQDNPSAAAAALVFIPDQELCFNGVAAVVPMAMGLVMALLAAVFVL